MPKIPAVGLFRKRTLDAETIDLEDVLGDYGFEQHRARVWTSDELSSLAEDTQD